MSCARWLHGPFGQVTYSHTGLFETWDLNSGFLKPSSFQWHSHHIEEEPTSILQFPCHTLLEPQRSTKVWKAAVEEQVQQTKENPSDQPRKYPTGTSTETTVSYMLMLISDTVSVPSQLFGEQARGRNPPRASNVAPFCSFKGLVWCFSLVHLLWNQERACCFRNISVSSRAASIPFHPSQNSSSRKKGSDYTGRSRCTVKQACAMPPKR